MRHLFLFMLVCTLPVVVVAQTGHSVSQPLSRNSVRDWADRVTSNDAKVRASAVAALVKRGSRSLPLLRRFLNSDNEELHNQTFEIIRWIGPPAIPLLVELQN